MTSKQWGKHIDELRRSIDDAAAKRLDRVGRTIAQQLRTKREQRKLSQSAMATLLGTGQSRVSQMEDEEYGKLNLSSLARAAVCLDCDLIVEIVDRRPDSATALDERDLRACLLQLAADSPFTEQENQLTLFGISGSYGDTGRSENNVHLATNRSNKLRL